MSERIENAVVADVVVATVRIAAEPATVWSFLSDGAKFASWIGAFAGGPPPEGTTIEPRVGGTVRVSYPACNVKAVGKIVSMEPMKKLALTWGYDDNRDGMGPGSTHVEITLTPVADGTIVQLRHWGLPTDKVRHDHLGGWVHYLSMLAGRAADAQHAASFAQRWSEYFQAWNEDDDAARTRLLAACCEPSVRLRTSFACTEGIADFSSHVANGRKHMPGMSLQIDGPPQTVHGYSRVGWKVVSPDGHAAMRGTNFAALSLSGKFTTVVSFPAAPKGANPARGGE